MPISFQCGCGRTLRVKDELAGRKVRCPECSTILAVPKSDTEFHVTDVSVAATPSDVEKEPDWEESEAPIPVLEDVVAQNPSRPVQQASEPGLSLEERLGSRTMMFLALFATVVVFIIGCLLFAH